MLQTKYVPAEERNARKGQGAEVGLPPPPSAELWEPRLLARLPRPPPGSGSAVAGSNRHHLTHPSSAAEANVPCAPPRPQSQACCVPLVTLLMNGVHASERHAAPKQAGPHRPECSQGHYRSLVGMEEGVL